MIIFIKRYCMTKHDCLINYLRTIFSSLTKGNNDAFGSNDIVLYMSYPDSLVGKIYVRKKMLLESTEYNITSYLVENINQYFPFEIKEEIQNIVNKIIPEYL